MSNSQTTINIDIAEDVTKAYYPMFTSRARYLVYKGSRGSAKSYTAAIKVIVDVMTKPYVNWLVIRQYFTTHKDSTFATLKKVAAALGVYDLFKWNKSPLEVTYIPTGQTIFFRGMDDPLKITSITPTVGQLCRAWFNISGHVKVL